MSSTDFLSCDGNFLHLPDDRKFKNDKRKDFASTRISCLTSQLATDSPPRPPKLKDPHLCCVTTRTGTSFGPSSIIGSCLTMIAILAISGYFMVRLLTDVDKSHPLSLGKLLSVVLPACLILFCFMCFQWGLFSRRHFALLPFILGTLLLLVALIGTLVASMLMLPGEVDDIAQKSSPAMTDRSAGRMGEAIAIRGGVCAVVLLQLLLLYAYLRTFFYLRYLNRNN